MRRGSSRWCNIACRCARCCAVFPSEVHLKVTGRPSSSRRRNGSAACRSGERVIIGTIRHMVPNSPSTNRRENGFRDLICSDIRQKLVPFRVKCIVRSQIQVVLAPHGGYIAIGVVALRECPSHNNHLSFVDDVARKRVVLVG